MNLQRLIERLVGRYFLTNHQWLFEATDGRITWLGGLAALLLRTTGAKPSESIEIASHLSLSLSRCRALDDLMRAATVGLTLRQVGDRPRKGDLDDEAQDRDA